ncbi:hypothetical protein OPT61_g1820 [Boeremia exigua]|uniref:Uncharacterized protein n=1 Tax=Boeremia exigua TaxID=749465 RepID=A0ACC2INX9_9PLEO|nr:hypothetical protein OPT61_g1820 [Boeremia exigua]
MNDISSQSKASAAGFLSIFKQRNKKPSKIAPQSYNDNRQCRSMRLLSIASLSILLLLSIPTLALKAYSYSFIESNAEMGFYLMTEGMPKPTGEEVLVAALPHNLFRVPEKLVLVVAMLNILLSMAHLAFVAWEWKAGRQIRTQAFRRNAMVLHIINAVLVLTALIAMSVSDKASSKFEYDLIPKEPNAVSPSGYRYYRYDSGIFDLETWTCELMKPEVVGEARSDYRAQCEIEVAGRTIMAPFFLAALAVASLSVWTFFVGRKQEPRSDHTYTKEIDLEGGSEAEAGKQIQVEEVELATLPRPERQHDARLSKIEEDGEETEEMPKNASTVAKGAGTDVVQGGTTDVDAKNAGSTS